MKEIKELMLFANKSAEASEEIVLLAKEKDWDPSVFSSAIKTIHNLLLEKENGNGKQII